MRTLNLLQNTKEWLETRSLYLTASEAPAMMGHSKYQTRDELIHAKKTLEVKEVDNFTQSLFDKGHAAEKAILPHIEKIIGEELFPTTGVDDIENIPLLASFDGITLMGDIVFEHKLFNTDLALIVKNNEELPDHYKWQLDQQLLLSGAKKAIFVVSDGSLENMSHCFYEPNYERFNQLLNGWKQFIIDSDEYVPKEIKPEVIAKSATTLPALSIEFKGAITASNLSQYQASALTYIESINTDLATDQNFADAETDIKNLKKAEKELKDVEHKLMTGTADLAEANRVIGQLKSQCRDTRLMLEKTVKAEKQNRKLSIANEAKQKLERHIQELEIELQGMRLIVDVNWNEALKNIRTISSLENAANSTLANAKIEANEKAQKIRSNLALFDELTSDANIHLFNDKERIIDKLPEDLRAVIESRLAQENIRIEAAKKAEAERIEFEAERQERIKADAILTQEAKPASIQANTESKEAEIITQPIAKQDQPLTLSTLTRELFIKHEASSQFTDEMMALLDSFDIVSAA